jgi:hypothetical protein
MSNALSSIYKGSASFGRFTAMFIAIIVTIICIIVVIGSIKSNTDTNKYSKTSDAKIINKNCTVPNMCEYKLNYLDENNQLVYAKITTSINNMNINSLVNISYDPSNKQMVRLTSENQKTSILGVILVCAIISGGFWLWVWVTRKYEFAASASGISTVFDIFNR